MRVGLNPNRSNEIKPGVFGSTIASAIVHLPNMEGYHAKRFGVVKHSLFTMRDHAGVDCRTLVWDNGSCDEMRRWLTDVYKPDWLVLSPNVGKSTARAGILGMIPPHSIIGVADDDMHYYPDWFRISIDVLETFPSVGQVSGYPVRTQMRWGNTKTIRWANEHATVERGKFIPAEYDRDFCTSIGRQYDDHLHTSMHDLDTRITYKDYQVYATAHHCQWVGYGDVMRRFCIPDTLAAADEKPFDNAVDEAGLLRLTTTKRYTRHIGNIMDDELKETL